MSGPTATVQCTVSEDANVTIGPIRSNVCHREAEKRYRLEPELGVVSKLSNCSIIRKYSQNLLGWKHNSCTRWWYSP